MIEGGSASTAVNGERTPLNPGKFVITPCWSRHDHVNQGARPVQRKLGLWREERF